MIFGRRSSAALPTKPTKLSPHYEICVPRQGGSRHIGTSRGAHGVRALPAMTDALFQFCFSSADFSFFVVMALK
jgi:hypothetical protein